MKYSLHCLILKKLHLDRGNLKNNFNQLKRFTNQITKNVNNSLWYINEPTRLSQIYQLMILLTFLFIEERERKREKNQT